MENNTETPMSSAKPKIRSMAELVLTTPKERNIVWFFRFENGDVVKRTGINYEYKNIIIPQAEYNPTNEINALKKKNYKVSVHRIEGDDGKWIYLEGDGPDDKTLPPYKEYIP